MYLLYKTIMKPLLYTLLIFILGVLALTFVPKTMDNTITVLPTPPNQLEIYRSNLKSFTYMENNVYRPKETN